MRPLSATSFSCLLVIRSERSPEFDCNCSWPASAVTLTVSAMVPTCRTRSPALSLSAALRTTLLASSFLKPCASTVIEYVAGRRLGTTNSPASDEVTVRVTPMASLRTVTVALGTIAPLTSLTEPKIVPDVTCANSAPLRQTANEIKKTRLAILCLRMPYIPTSLIRSRHSTNAETPFLERGQSIFPRLPVRPVGKPTSFNFVENFADQPRRTKLHLLQSNSINVVNTVLSYRCIKRL